MFMYGPVLLKDAFIPLYSQLDPSNWTRSTGPVQITPQSTVMQLIAGIDLHYIYISIHRQFISILVLLRNKLNLSHQW